MGVYEASNVNNVLSETNECVLLNCQNARCLIMSQRSVMNNTSENRYDGKVFELNSMGYHVGISKGYVLDDELDLFSMHDRTNSKKRKIEN